MLVVRRGTKMKLKIALAIFISALIIVFVWYYVNTGENPMVEIKRKVGSFVAKYYNPKDSEDQRDENTSQTSTRQNVNTSLPTTTLQGESEMKNTVDEIAKHDTFNGNWVQPANHETGHIALINTRPNVQMMNALRVKATITYSEGVLKNARETFYREARPANRSNEKFAVLFLHGVGLTSAIWINIGTFQILAEMGYRAVAIDLPGNGNSNNVERPYSREDILSYMTNVFTALQLHLPVLVSPSKAGEYAMPLVMAYPHVLRGLVAIAPSDTSHYFISDYKKLTVPLLAMFGEKDDTWLKSSSLDNLFYVPNRKIYMIKNTTHSCYVDHPPTFHKLLLQFLDRVKD